MTGSLPWCARPTRQARHELCMHLVCCNDPPEKKVLRFLGGRLGTPLDPTQFMYQKGFPNSNFVKGQDALDINHESLPPDPLRYPTQTSRSARLHGVVLVGAQLRTFEGIAMGGLHLGRSAKEGEPKSECPDECVLPPQKRQIRCIYICTI